MKIIESNDFFKFYEHNELVGIIDTDIPIEKKLKIIDITSYKKGYGKIMFDYVKERYRLDVDEIFGAMLTGSEGFYEKMGATFVDGSRYYGDEKKGQPYFSILLY